jgi:hypothetical protein
MHEQKLFSLEELRHCFEAIKPELIRYPSLNPDLLRNKIEKFIENCESTLEDNK